MIDAMLQARTRAVTPQESHRQASQEGSTAAGVGHQNSEGEDTEQQSDSATNPEDEVKQGSRASESLDVRWSERLVLELPPDTEEDEVTLHVPTPPHPYANLPCDQWNTHPSLTSGILTTINICVRLLGLK